MIKQKKHLYEFGSFCLDATDRLLICGEKTFSLPPKVFDTLLVLVESQGRVLEKDLFLNLIWPDTFVEESNLSQNIFQLRKVLGETDPEQRYIETIPKRGYRFVVPVKEIIEQSEPPISQMVEPHISSNQAIALSHNVLADSEVTNQLQNNRAENSYSPIINTPIIEKSLFKRYVYPLTILAIVILISSIWYSYKIFSKVSEPFQNMHVTKLTTNGCAKHAVISPDGKYVAYIKDDLVSQSLWIQQVATASTIQLVTTPDINYKGLTFSPDGNFIYYVTNNKVQQKGILYQIPTLGGVPKKILEQVGSSITFSPDSKEFAFVRTLPAQDQTAIMIAKADGSNEREIANSRTSRSVSLASPCWSPDGQTIAYIVQRLENGISKMSIAGIQVKNGVEIPMTDQEWSWVGQVAWVADSSAIIAVAWQQNAPIFADQIWYLPLPKSPAKRITNDLNGYAGISIASNSQRLVTVQSTRISQIWVEDPAMPQSATKITAGFGDNYSELFGINWTLDNKIVYTSHTRGNPDIWIMDRDGSNQKPLTNDAGSDLLPVTSPDGHTIIFVSNRLGYPTLWKMDINGNNLKQLTTDLVTESPTITPDGKWVVYQSSALNKPYIYKVSIDGGEAIQITHAISTKPAISPDGKWLACYYQTPSTQFKLALIEFDKAEPTKLFEPISDLPSLKWKMDSMALTYIKTEHGVANIWEQPIDGTMAKSLTNFTSDQLYRFAWSRDGKTLAYERGITINDIILISDFK